MQTQLLSVIYYFCWLPAPTDKFIVMTFRVQKYKKKKKTEGPINCDSGISRAGGR